MTYTAGVLDASHAAIWSNLTVIGARLRVMPFPTPTSTAWPANNEAYLFPFPVASPVTFNRMAMQAGTGPGTTNFDLGIYNDDFQLIRSIGATASVNTTDLIIVTAFSTLVTLPRGRYFMAMSSASTSLTTRASVPTNQQARAFGMFKMASAHPLPATFVPASVGTTAYLPNMALLTPAATIL